jgi:hypothetical protein
MPPIRPFDPGLARQVALQGALGLSRAEIAVQLGASLADFDAWAAEHPAFAQALADADTQARAWWDAQPREALAAGRTFRAAAWAKAYAQRFGRSSDRPQSAKAASQPRTITARVELPDNGRERRPPGGGARR